ncbi:hypothetical protein C8J56DRAFT_1083129 [Mycena floridula]|nr:hypothetical protein C8J56DRAFT_1083129 [Mycena floridula]
MEFEPAVDPDTIDFTDFAYCALCDEYFQNNRKRQEHIEESDIHPECRVCGRRFLNGDILRKLQHYEATPNHHFCLPCDQVFRTAGGYQIHLETAYMHRCNSDSEDEDDLEEDQEYGWEDSEAEIRFPEEVPEYSSPFAYLVQEPWEHDDSCDFEDREDLDDPPFEFDADDEDDEDTDEVFTCSVCDLSPIKIACTPCGHIFCTPCLKLSQAVSSKCPDCEEEVNPEHIRRIFVSTQ